MLKKIKELIKTDNYIELKKEISKLEYVEIADLLQELNDKEQIKLFNLLPKTLAAQTFAYLDLESQEKIINELSGNEVGKIIDEMYADDAADLIDEMPSNVVTKILENTTPETRKIINTLLKYPEESAGSIMTVDFLELKGNQTIEEAIEKVKAEAEKKESIDFCYILDDERKLLGTLSLRQLLLADKKAMIYDIMKKSPKHVNTLTDQELVAQKMKKYDINVISVVDSERRLVGIITIDDIVDVIEDEATEDIQKMAAIRPSDKPYMSMNTFEIWKKRIPWLLLLMISATFTSKIIQYYEDALSKFVILTSFIPMFMDTAGNAGGQASVTIIRGLSLNEITFKDTLKIVFKEFKVSILVGITLAIANFLKLMLLDHIAFNIALVVCITLIITIMIAKIIGCSLPMLAKKLGFDPAVMASPFITTIVDAVSLIVFFNVATSILGL